MPAAQTAAVPYQVAQTGAVPYQVAQTAAVPYQVAQTAAVPYQVVPYQVAQTAAVPYQVGQQALACPVAQPVTQAVAQPVAAEALCARLESLLGAAQREEIPATLPEFQSATFRDPQLVKIQNLVNENYDKLRQHFVEAVAPEIHGPCDLAFFINDVVFYAWLIGRPMTGEEYLRAQQAGVAQKMAWINAEADKAMLNHAPSATDAENAESDNEDDTQQEDVEGFTVIEEF